MIYEPDRVPLQMHCIPDCYNTGQDCPRGRRAHAFLIRYSPYLMHFRINAVLRLDSIHG